jgi:hypothetical protein
MFTAAPSAHPKFKKIKKNQDFLKAKLNLNNGSRARG